MKPDYITLFNAVEGTLIEVGKQNGVADIEDQLGIFKKIPHQSFEDADYYRKIVHVTFYSGFKAATVDKKLPVINEWFPDYQTVARYGPSHITQMQADERMIRHPHKLSACIENARIFQSVVTRHGSFQRYLESFAPRASFQNLMKLRTDLKKFAFLSNITSLHFLMDIGFPVLKPDRVIIRIFHRLGFLKDENVTEDQILKAVQVGHEFANATGHPIRYVDIVFVAYGQVSTGSGTQQGICLKDNPRCSICGVNNLCSYVKNMPQAVADRPTSAAPLQLPPTAFPNPMETPSFWKQKGGPCPICKWPETVGRRSRTTGELYFGCTRPKHGPSGGCPFKGNRSH